MRLLAGKQGCSGQGEVSPSSDATIDLPEEIFLLALHAATSEDGGVEMPPRAA